MVLLGILESKFCWPLNTYCVKIIQDLEFKAFIFVLRNTSTIMCNMYSRIGMDVHIIVWDVPWNKMAGLSDCMVVIVDLLSCYTVCNQNCLSNLLFYVEFK